MTEEDEPSAEAKREFARLAQATKEAREERQELQTLRQQLLAIPPPDEYELEEGRIREALERALHEPAQPVDVRARELLREALDSASRPFESYGVPPMPSEPRPTPETAGAFISELSRYLQPIEDGAGSEPERARALREALIAAGVLFPRLEQFERVGLLYLRFRLDGQSDPEALEQVVRLLGYEAETARRYIRSFFGRVGIPRRGRP